GNRPASNAKAPWMWSTGPRCDQPRLRLAVAEGGESGVRRSSVVAEATVLSRVHRSPVDPAVVPVVMREQAEGAMASVARVSVRVITRVVRECNAPTEQCAYRDRDRNYGHPHPATPFWLRLTELRHGRQGRTDRRCSRCRCGRCGWRRRERGPASAATPGSTQRRTGSLTS